MGSLTGEIPGLMIAHDWLSSIQREIPKEGRVLSLSEIPHLQKSPGDGILGLGSTISVPGLKYFLSRM